MALQAQAVAPGGKKATVGCTVRVVAGRTAGKQAALVPIFPRRADGVEVAGFLAALGGLANVARVAVKTCPEGFLARAEAEAQTCAAVAVGAGELPVLAPLEVEEPHLAPAEVVAVEAEVGALLG